MPILKVLKSGETDIDSSDIWRFAFHSNYPTFKIKESGSQEKTLASGETEVSHVITHNLGYYPMFFAGVEFNSKYYPIQGFGIDTAITGIDDEYGDPTSILTYAFPQDINSIKFGFVSVPYAAGEDVDITFYWTIMLDEN